MDYIIFNKLIYFFLSVSLSILAMIVVSRHEVKGNEPLPKYYNSLFMLGLTNFVLNLIYLVDALR